MVETNESSFIPQTLSTPKLSLQILPFGLTFYSLTLKSKDGQLIDVLLGPKNPLEYQESRTFRNQIIGRVANRLPPGKWTACDGRTQVQLESVEPSGACLHGGIDAIDTRTFKILPLEPTDLFPSISENSLLFEITSPHGDNGYPGKLLIQALLTLRDNKLRYVIKAKLQGDEADATPLNLTIHWGFYFGGKYTAKDYSMWADVDKVSEISPKDFIPTGGLADVKGTIFDFTQGGPNDKQNIRKFGDNWDAESGVDHSLIFQHRDSQDAKVVLIGPSTSTVRPVLTFRSNQPSVQCYTSKFFDGSGTRKALHGGDKGYEKFEGVFLEFQEIIGACLPGSAYEGLRERNGGNGILKRGEIYENWVELEVEE